MTQLHRRFDFLSKRARRGVSLLWIIIAFPALVLFLVFAVEIGNIWLARIELEQSLEANALAAVKQWAEGGTLDTNAARSIGNVFSIANPVRGVAVDLANDSLNPVFDGTLNYDPSPTAINGNASAKDISGVSYIQSSVMVFGAITQREAEVAGQPSVIFDASTIPNCSTNAPSVLIDASAQSDMNADDSWGISLGTSPVPSVNQNLRITRIEIDVDPSMSNNLRFADVLASLTAGQLSDNIPPHKISAGPGQPDNYFNNVLLPVVVFSRSLDNRVLNIDINTVGPGGLQGLAPGERFRFGARLVELGAMGTQTDVDGDAVGLANAEIRVYYAFAGFLLDMPAIGNFGNTAEPGGDCPAVPTIVQDDLGNDHTVVHPTGILDLPCPPGLSGGDNDQSYAEIELSTLEQPYAVRSQGQILVPSVVDQILGFKLGPWGVSAKATAYFDCQTSDAKLIRIDQFIGD